MQNRKLNILVLGGNSFIGSHLIKSLSGNEEIQLTIFSRSEPASISSGIKVMLGDYTDKTILASALKDQDIVYHFISQSYPFSTWDDPSAELTKNISPFLDFIGLCNDAGVKKIAFASSGGTVYGAGDNISDESCATRPYTPYGMTKLYMENLLQYAKSKYAIENDIYRMSNVYGDDQVTQKGLGFIHAALECAIKGRPITIFGDGTNTRDYIYIDDVCNFLALSLAKPLNSSGVYNVCSNTSVSLNDILQIMREDLHLEFTVNFQPGRKSDVPAVSLDNSRILKEFPGYRFVSLKQGIEKIYLSLSGKVSI